ncbi:MAG TPA: DNA (cytosine-5-)-methyltransferase [Candidatus Anaerotignum merdipullorum]|nr:DNA (cytosine-5-)-methyltransferase [Candidatus Anaerotignum merdipullorum]
MEEVWMKFLDFFAGIGGFRRGMELAGHECVGFCEQDKFAYGSYVSMHLLTEEQRERIMTMPKNKRIKEIGKEEYRNGEWYARNIREIRADHVPRAECWCFGFPCQDISVAGKQLGFRGERSSLFFSVMRIIQDTKEEDRPTYLFIENVKNLLSVNGGTDFLKLLIALDEAGYDAEWQVLNSSDFGVPQNRERVFIVGHHRGKCRHEVFPVYGTDGKNHVEQVGNYLKTATRDNPNQGRIYELTGLSPCLNKMEGGGREPSVVLPCFVDMSYGSGGKETDNAFCLQSRYDKGICGRKRETVGVCIPVLTPDRAEKRQDGRRFKENGEPMFTLTGQDRHGIAIEMDDDFCVNAIWSDKYGCYIAIRKLTPKECFRLQGWEDIYFERAEMVNSDSQLYKQAGNGVTVNVIEAIAKKMEMEQNG